jgi:hypothetical protein
MVTALAITGHTRAQQGWNEQAQDKSAGFQAGVVEVVAHSGKGEGGWKRGLACPESQSPAYHRVDYRGTP